METMRRMLGLASKPQRLQQSLDLCELAVHFRMRLKEKVDLDFLLGLSSNEQNNLVQHHAHAQIFPLLEAVRKARETIGSETLEILTDSQGRTESNSPELEERLFVKSKVKETETDGTRLASAPSVTAFGNTKIRPVEVDDKQEKYDMLIKEVVANVGFAPVVKPSTLEHSAAGMGLFASDAPGAKAIPRGSVFAFYPGTVYIPYQLGEILGKKTDKLLSEYKKVYGLQNDHVIQRHDGIVINAHELTSDVYQLENPFASGHMINHPAKDSLPNSIVCYYDMPSVDLDEELAQLLRSKYYKDPMLSRLFDPMGKVRMHASLIVAACDIPPGHEIFLNYRYNPGLPKNMVPDWYHPIDIEENKRRWNRGL